MGRRYYCDYCDKTFIDDLEARRRHLQGSYHIKFRNLHYEHYREPHIILREECEKTPCKRFFNNGMCQFSGMCKYSHYSPEQLLEIKQQVDYQNSKTVRVPTLESWLHKYYEKQSKDNNREQDDVIHIPWSYPEHLENRTDLPPSIRKLKVEQSTTGEFSEWGK